MHCKYGFMRSVGEWKGKWELAFYKVDIALVISPWMLEVRRGCG
jgi:hypothetical protein